MIRLVRYLELSLSRDMTKNKSKTNSDHQEQNNNCQDYDSENIAPSLQTVIAAKETVRNEWIFQFLFY